MSGIKSVKLKNSQFSRFMIESWTCTFLAINIVFVLLQKLMCWFNSSLYYYPHTKCGMKLRHNWCTTVWRLIMFYSQPRLDACSSTMRPAALSNLSTSRASTCHPMLVSRYVEGFFYGFYCIKSSYCKQLLSLFEVSSHASKSIGRGILCLLLYQKIQ